MILPLLFNWHILISLLKKVKTLIFILLVEKTRVLCFNLYIFLSNIVLARFYRDLFVRNFIKINSLSSWVQWVVHRGLTQYMIVHIIFHPERLHVFANTLPQSKLVDCPFTPRGCTYLQQAYANKYKNISYLRN